MIKFISKIFDHISFLRPLLLIPVWTPSLLGFWAGGATHNAGNENELLLLTTFLAVGVYGINQIFDMECDKLNSKHLPLALGFISRTAGWIITVGFFLGALILGIFKSFPVALLTIAGIILGIVYSAPPFRLKDRTYPALISNALGHGALIYLLGFVFAAGVFELSSLPRTIPYIFAYGAVYMFTTIPDFDGDKKLGKMTFAVVFGHRRTMLFALSGVFLGGAFGIIFREPAVFLTAVISLPFYIAAICQPHIKPNIVVRANKVSITVLALLVCFYFPLFIFPIFTAVAFAAIYNRKRLSVKYP